MHSLLTPKDRKSKMLSLNSSIGIVQHVEPKYHLQTLA